MREGDDDFPERDFDDRQQRNQQDAVQKIALQTENVTKWDRKDLEERYIKMYNEYLVLKKYTRKQEEKIKKMSTYQLRLAKDNKKLTQDPTGKRVIDAAGKGDMATQQEMRIRELEKLTIALKMRLAAARQGQAFAVPVVNQGTAYGHVQALVETGIPHMPGTERQRIQRNMRVTGPYGTVARRGASSPMQQSRGVHSQYEDPESKQLQARIARLESQASDYQHEIEILNEQMRMREAAHDEDMLQLRQKRGDDTRANISENTEMIRQQRELKEKSASYTQLHAQYVNLEEKFRIVKTNNEQVLREMDSLNHQIHQEQSKVLSLQTQLKEGKTSQRTVVEHQHRLNDLENECQILKQANEKLLSSAFDLEKERDWRQRENALKVQIAQLEATLRADVGEKGGILDRLSDERDTHDKLETEHRELRVKYFETKLQHEDLMDKMKYFSKDSSVDFTDLEEALVLVKQRRESKEPELDFLQRVEEEQHKDVEKLLRTLRAEHADTINELEKTRNMLIVQHKINKDYQQEVEAVTKKMDENKKEYDTRQDEYAQLLDIRAARIRKLEHQMKDVAYGTRQYKVKPDEAEGVLSDDEDMEQTIELELGQNLFEIHVKRVVVSDDGLRRMNDIEPNIFCTWEFYEFELQTTAIQRGPRADFEMTSQYIVQVDDFFLHYLQKDSCAIELHQSFGTDYHTVAAGTLRMRDILEKSQGRLHGTLQLTGVGDSDIGVPFGTVEYWVRLRVPMEQALRLYKERSKALGYLESNILKGDHPTLSPMDSDAAIRAPDNVNQLYILIDHCSNVNSRRNDMQPNLYCVYKFFDFPDHDTKISHSSNSPHFDDNKTYPVGMTADFDKYLKSQPLKIYVFDDTDPDPSSLLGVATIPLIPLSHDKPVSGTFELIKKDGSHNGTVEVSMSWKYTYLPPKGSTKTSQQMRSTGGLDIEPVSLLPGEGEAMQQSVKASTSRPTSSKSKTSPKGAVSSMKASSTTVGGAPSKPSSRQSPVVRQDVVEPRPPSAASRKQTPVQTPQKSPSPNRHEAVVEESMVSEDESLGVVTDMDEEEELTPRPDDQRHMATPSGRSVQPGRQSGSGKQTPAGQTTSDIGGDTNLRVALSSSQENQDSEPQDSDVEIVPSSRNRPASDIVTVIVNYVSLNSHATVLDNDVVKMLFVEYRFLGEPLQETETPYALPKPTVPDKPIHFNFTKVFHVDFATHYERRQYLGSMLLPDDPDQGRIRFTLVNEPQDDDGDCDDIGVAFVSIPDILRNGRDLNDQEVPIYSVEDETTCIGSLGVTVQCLAALRAVQQQLASLRP